MNVNPQRCALCGGESTIVYRDHPGYQVGMRYDIARCPVCSTAFALPLQVDEKIYETIYANIDRVPGYMRYANYARRVAGESDALGYLAGAEDVYWAIASRLGELPGPGRTRILEIGCGRGYLTYALAQRGYDVVGLDVSQTAIDAATKAFGDHFVCADVRDYARTHAGRFDVVIMTEVIEHLPDPRAFLETALALTRPDGEVLLTTPNRSAYHPGVIWDTEAPPVHLWWFSEASIVWLARSLGCSARFVDFAAYHASHPIDLRASEPPPIPRRVPFLDEHSQLIEEGARRRYRHPLSWRIGRLFAPKRRRRIDFGDGGRRRTVLCAAITRAP